MWQVLRLRLFEASLGMTGGIGLFRFGGEFLDGGDISIEVGLVDDLDGILDTILLSGAWEIAAGDLESIEEDGAALGVDIAGCDSAEDVP